MNRLRRLRDDESGMTFVFVGLGFMAFLAATMLAIDVGMLFTARAQAQNSADAGALGGAVALVFNDYNDRSPDGPAVQSALAAATANPVMGANVSVGPADVEFLNDAAGQPNRVRVTVYRRADRGNPVATQMARYFGIDTADIAATATAEAAPANAMSCVKPFTIPDRWIEGQDPPWDADDTFDVVDNRGRPLANPDIYIPADQPGYTGYNSERDRGTQITIKASNGNNIYPSFYFPYAIEGSSGADDYQWNIANCNQTIMGWGDLLTAEPGNMVGPTQFGVDELIAQDPTAYWDAVGHRAVSSMNPSPRIVAIPVFDPIYYDTGKQNGRNADLKVANYIGIFIEGMQGGDVIARITPISGLIRGGAGPAPQGAFPRAIILVQ